jgi:hypothetical protein
MKLFRHVAGIILGLIVAFGVWRIKSSVSKIKRLLIII